MQPAFDFRKRHDDPCDAAVVLVHGLGGSPEGTWGKMPDLLLEEQLSADVATCKYESGHRRKFFKKQAGIEEMAPVYAHAIRDAQHYEHFVLVGHSMGGLLCMAVIKHLLDVREEGRGAVDRVAGLFLLATPQAGSAMVRGPMRWTRDGRDLVTHSKLAERLNKAFSNGVAMSPRAATNGSKVLIPTFAVIPTSDRWVDSYSASVGLEDRQEKRVFGTHTSVSKPESRDDDTHRWMVDRIDECLKLARDRASLQQAQIKQPASPRTSVTASDVLPEEVAQVIRDLPHGVEITLRIRSDDPLGEAA